MAREGTIRAPSSTRRNQLLVKGEAMPASVIVGLQWGDEGKGKTTDFLAEQVAAVVRYQGGDNAGHTIVIGEDTFKLHLVPSGVLYRHITPINRSGMLVLVGLFCLHNRSRFPLY